MTTSPDQYCTRFRWSMHGLRIPITIQAIAALLSLCFVGKPPSLPLTPVGLALSLMTVAPPFPFELAVLLAA